VLLAKLQRDVRVGDVIVDQCKHCNRIISAAQSDEKVAKIRPANKESGHPSMFRDLDTVHLDFRIRLHTSHPI